MEPDTKAWGTNQQERGICRGTEDPERELGSWIKEPYDEEAIFQLDQFHIYQEIKRKLKEKEAQKSVTELFESR